MPVSKQLKKGVLNVKHKFMGRGQSLSDFKAHDAHRHSRMLGSVDLPLGGTALPTEAGLYYARISLGTPPKSYYVQVDTGSDILWVNCVECIECPRKSELGIELTLYDIRNSASANMVACDESFCSELYGSELVGCAPNVSCQYSVTYGDGSSTAGYFVKDSLQYSRVSGNFQTKTSKATVIFGCGAKQSGDLGSSTEAVDGILGFGQSNSSMISQLASSGAVKKMFAHCLGSIDGGGIFAIGHVVQPKVRTTPLVPNQPHYNVNLKAVEVGGTVLELPTDLFDSESVGGAIIDSGTTLAYLPEAVYNPVFNAIRSSQPNMKFQKVPDEFLCFPYTESVDDGFPTVKFHFENSLSLMVYPHDYLFHYQDDLWCIGWQNSGMQSKDTKEMTLLGDLVLANKLVVYDLENQVIGWTEYNCIQQYQLDEYQIVDVNSSGRGSSTIKMQDDKTGAVYTVGSHNLQSTCSLEMSFSVLLLLAVMMLNLIC